LIGPNTFPGLALELAGGALAIDGVRQLLPALRSARWIAARGEIIASHPVSSPGRIQLGKGSVVTWDPGVVYQYTVDGAVYQSQRVSFFGQSPSYEGAGRVARRFPRGRKVTVWHDPIRHDQSVLIRGPGIANFFELAAGCLLFIVGVIVRSAG
jgi:hypothetical protein